MFNLFRSKGKAVKWLLGGLLFLVALSMLLYLVPNYTDPNQIAGDPVLLTVGPKKIRSTEAQTGYQQFAKGKIPVEMMNVYFPQYIDELKMRYAALEQARRLGITASDAEVAETVMLAPAWSSFFKDGKLVRRTEFEAALAAQGGTPDELFNVVREELTLVKLQDVIAENTVVTPQEIEEEYKRKYERATVDFVAFTEAELRSSVKVTDADIQKRYDERKSSFVQPEKYDFRVLVLSRDRVEANLKISEQELRAEYSAALDNFRSPEQIRARHILLTTDGKSDADKKSIRAKADDLVKQLKGGADFADLAKKNSEDSGNASLGGDLGTFSRGSKDKDFESAAFNLKVNEISGVVSSQFGYHIIQVLEKIPSTITPFETVRADLERELRNSKMADLMQTTSTQMQAEFARNPGAAADIAKKYNAELINVTDGARGAAIPTLGVTPEIDNLLPGMQPGAVSQALTLPGDRVAVAVLDKKIPGRPATLDEVREQIRQDLITDGSRLLVEARGKEAAERIRKGEDVQAVAKALGGMADGASNFGITDSIPGIGPALYLQDAFKKGAGTIIGPSVFDGRTVVAKVLSKTEADMTGLGRERESLLTGLKSARAQQTNRLWMDSIVRDLTESGDMVVNQPAIQQVIASLTPR